MQDRIKLHEVLLTIINNVYYQPPQNINLQYPCIIYNQEVGDVKKANNNIYNYTKRYTITIMSTVDNDDIINTMLSTFNYCSVDNIFVNDNLYHYIFTIYF